MLGKRTPTRRFALIEAGWSHGVVVSRDARVAASNLTEETIKPFCRETQLHVIYLRYLELISLKRAAPKSYPE